MDIVEYAEKVCDVKLLESQKILLRKMSSLPKDSMIVYGRYGRIYIVPKKKTKGAELKWLDA